MIILIDDDRLIHISWKLRARKVNLEIHCYFSVDDFFQNSAELAKDAQIFIDSDLGKGQKGEILSKEIYDKGFTDISLCTGYTDLGISEFSWIKRKITKSPPF